MINAKHVAAALVECNNAQWYVVGSPLDIQRLYDAGFTLQVWDIRLDNGHRPYPAARKWVNYQTAAAGEAAMNIKINSLTHEIMACTGLCLTENLVRLEDTFLFRPTPAFWEDLLLAYAAPDGKVHGVNPADFYAIYRGYVNQRNGTIKFIRVEAASVNG